MVNNKFLCYIVSVFLASSSTLLVVNVKPVDGFGLHAAHSIPDTFHLVQTAATALQHQVQHVGWDALNTYKQTLAIHPLTTKMATGATLAVCGDAIAQTSQHHKASVSADEGEGKEFLPFEYDTRRATSFAVFDSAYRALQHVSFPLIVQHCQGQVLGNAMTTALAMMHVQMSIHTANEITSYGAAMEQTLASQLGIVPFLYYPAFFTLTALVQGITSEQAIQRAQENFIPLMKRNLCFWIPVQFVQFGFVPEELQIPFLSVCGLAWTFILSVAAGNAKTSTPQTPPALAAQEEAMLAEAAAKSILSEEQRSAVTAQSASSRVNPTANQAATVAEAR